ncbi:hypothetical protein ABMA28_013011 [Loxostege sticticalis]|uniref:Uncharacterized protein n=1 Tax=Loxostege sticticalis TaxID=481309 RepID=A0ABD0S3F9_LOXSC
MTTKKTNEGNKVKTEMNIMDTCRVCMFKHLQMSYIFDTDCDIIEKILYCTGIQITKDDGLPSQICNNCVNDLAIAYKFKTSCILANDTYQKLLKEGIKTEIEYNDSDGYSDDFFEVKKEQIDEETERYIPAEKQQVKRGPRGPYKKKDNSKQRPLRKYKFRKLWCATCKISFKTKQEKDDHQKIGHNSEPETSICEHCGKLFKNMSSMYSHMRTHLPPKYACDQCDYKATFKHDLAKHLLMHAGLKLYQCQMCASRYRTASGLSQHIHREHEGVPKRFQCELCEKGFFDRTKYSRHMDSHNNIKRFECEVCHSSFTRRCYWKKHRLLKHNIVMPRQRPGRQKINLIVGVGDKTENVM